MHDHSLAHQGGGLGTLGGAGQTFYEQRQKLLQVSYVNNTVIITQEYA